MPAPRNLLSLKDLAQDDLDWIIRRGRDHAESSYESVAFRSRVVGMLFTQTSTRTRTAFAAAVLRLGGNVVSFGPGDLQLNTGETLEDTGRVLGGMLDALVVRTAGDPLELRKLAAASTMPLVNAMTADEHPTQAISDLTFLCNRFGSLDGLRMLYIGEGNNTAVALGLALPRYSRSELYFHTPPGFGLPADALVAARRIASLSGATLEESHDFDRVPPRVDVVYTTRWETTGTVKSDPGWRATFAPFRVDEALLRRYPGALFMHDLPAHRGDEVTPGVIDGRGSVVFAQSRYKLHSAMAIMEWCVLGP